MSHLILFLKVNIKVELSFVTQQVLQRKRNSGTSKKCWGRGMEVDLKYKWFEDREPGDVRLELCGTNTGVKAMEISLGRRCFVERPLGVHLGFFFSFWNISPGL